jgi:hypothetical protein
VAEARAEQGHAATSVSWPENLVLVCVEEAPPTCAMLLSLLSAAMHASMAPPRKVGTSRRLRRGRQTTRGRGRAPA